MCPSSTSNSEDGVAKDGLIAVVDKASLTRSSRIMLVVAVAVLSIVAVGTLALDVLAPAKVVKPTGDEARVQEKRRLAAAGFDGFASGRMAAQFERDFRDRSRIREVVNSHYALEMFKRFGATQNLAYISPEGRAYLKSRIAPHKHFNESVFRLQLNRVLATERRFAAAGIDLVPIVVPRKSVVEIDRLPKTMHPAPELEGRFTEGLVAAGIRTVDLVAAFAPADFDVFWRYDSHWSDDGCRMAAEVMTRAAGRLVPESDRLTSIEKNRKTREPADLLGSIGVLDIKLRNAFMPILTMNGIVVKATKRTAPNEPPKTPTPLSIVGSSYTAHSYLTRYLEHYSNEKVYSGAQPGTLPAVAIRDFLRTCKRTGVSPKTLLWEFPAHYIFCRLDSFDTTGAVLTALPAPASTPLVSVADWLGKSASLERRVPVNLGKQSGLTHHFGTDMILADGDGILSLRLRGTIAGASAYIRVSIKDKFERIELEPGPFDLTLPLIAPDAITNLTLAIRSDRVGASLTDFSGDLVVDLRSDGDIAGIPVGSPSTSATKPSKSDLPTTAGTRRADFPTGVPIPPRGGLLAEVRSALPKCTVTVDVKVPDATPSPNAPSTTLTTLTARGRVLVIKSLRTFAGASDPILTVTVDPPPKRKDFLSWARIAPQSRSTP